PHSIQMFSLGHTHMHTLTHLHGDSNLCPFLPLIFQHQPDRFSATCDKRFSFSHHSFCMYELTHTTHAHSLTNTHTHTHTHTRSHTLAHTHSRTHTQKHTLAHTHSRTHTHTHTLARTHT